jgi:hypothetical protein
LQAIAIAAIAVGLSLLWRSRAPFDVKAAALAAGAMLATPYLFLYDLVVLAVPVAFLLRAALADKFYFIEAIGLVAAGALILSAIVVPGPVGLVSTLIVAALIVRRAICTGSRASADLPARIR